MTYKNDPRMITAKFSSVCTKCNGSIKKGTPIYYWPADRKVFCPQCGKVPYQEFLSSVADEQVYSGTGNPYCG
jgi:hypothetical protein